MTPHANIKLVYRIICLLPDGYACTSWICTNACTNVAGGSEKTTYAHIELGRVDDHMHSLAAGDD